MALLLPLVWGTGILDMALSNNIHSLPINMTTVSLVLSTMTLLKLLCHESKVKKEVIVQGEAKGETDRLNWLLYLWSYRKRNKEGLLLEEPNKKWWCWPKLLGCKLLWTVCLSGSGRSSTVWLLMPPLGDLLSWYLKQSILLLHSGLVLLSAVARCNMYNNISSNISYEELKRQYAPKTWVYLVRTVQCFDKTYMWFSKLFCSKDIIYSRI